MPKDNSDEAKNDTTNVSITIGGFEELKEIANKFIERVINPPLQEISGLLADQVRFWRYKNQINIIIKAKQFVEEKGIEPKTIPVRTLAPLLEHASWEEDPDMQAKWSALLANALTSDYSHDIYSSYVEILKQLSPLEAKLLDFLFDEHIRHGLLDRFSDKEIRISGGEFVLGLVVVSKTSIFFGIISTYSNMPKEEFNILIDNLCRLNLLQSQSLLQFKAIHNIKNKYGLLGGPTLDDCYKIINLTSPGSNFVKSCRFQ